MRIDAVQTIKDRLTMREVLERYGYEPNRAGFVCCPFHNEKTASLKVYSGDGGWHCFGCGASGDVISFVEKLFGLSFSDALKKINDDFNLNLYKEKSLEDLRKSVYAEKAFKAKRKREELEREQEEINYWRTFDEWMRLVSNKRKYAPKEIGQEPHPLFVESLQKLSYQEHLLELAEIRRCSL